MNLIGRKIFISIIFSFIGLLFSTTSFADSTEQENEDYEASCVSQTWTVNGNCVIVNEDCLIEDLQPQSPYAKTKLREENLVKEMNKKHK